MKENLLKQREQLTQSHGSLKSTVYWRERQEAHYGQNIVSIKRGYIRKQGRGQTVGVCKAAEVGQLLSWS